MKSRFLWLLLAVTSATFNTAFADLQLHPMPYQSLAAHLSAEVMSRYHYKPLVLDDAASSKIFDNYLKILDGEKVFFLQADIDQLENARTKLDDAILNEDLSVPFAIFNLYQQRVTERLTYARSLLDKGFNFDREENYQYNRKNVPWSKSIDELNDLWRKRVKSDWLRLKLAGKDNKNIVDILLKRYDNSLKSLSKTKSDDAFQSFMNAYATEVDPHTDYFGVRASEEFDISMKLSLVGIGAVLQIRDDYTIIRDLVAGGPAILSGKLKVGDRIVGVGQGANSQPTDVLGWRIDDTVALIRGVEDTVVLLEILPAEAGPDGQHKFVPLIRKKISLEKQAAKKSVIEIKDGNTTRRIGVISLPTFYQDFDARKNGDKDFKSASRDVSRFLSELKQEKVDGVLMDLRNNGGGSLNEAIELTGLFIDQGPVVQERDAKGDVTIASDTHAGVAWNGPLGVLINRGSASASEIFAAAIQDYGRGLVIGERSFGKGTVQSVVNLDELVNNKKPELGELKMTIAQFFRINGGTTQLRGVTPDITLPSMIDDEEFGETSFDNALPWTQIKAADFTPVDNLTNIVDILKKRHDVRIRNDKDFEYLQEDINELNKRRNENQISLNEATRRKEREAQEAKMKLRSTDKKIDKNTKITRKKTDINRSLPLQDDGLQSNERNLDADLAIENASKNAKDVLLNEAVNILGDEVALLKAKM